MQIDRLLFPITTLGPGNRLVIWTIGCTKYCFNCTNPELWQKNPKKDIDVYELVKMIKQSVGDQIIDGITLTGGDPLEQIYELNKLLQLLNNITDDVLIYTGYTLEETKEILSASDWENLLKYTSVIIDGSYINELNDNKIPLRGSTNQNIIYLNESKRENYEAYLYEGRKVQNVYYNQDLISVGIHNKNQ